MTESEKIVQDILVALGKMEKSQEQTIGNINTLTTHMNTLLPVHKDIQYLKKFLYVCASLGLLYILWSSREFYALSASYGEHVTAQDINYKDVKKRTAKTERHLDRNHERIKLLEKAK